MKEKKEKLQKLINFVEELSKHEENAWFREELVSRLGAGKNESSHIEDIYEFCIRFIIKQHAEQFYRDLILVEIKDSLIRDFIRMEQYRRNDNFEDFCLATFQQCEGIVNTLCLRTNFVDYLRKNKNSPALLKWSSNGFKPGGNQTIGGLIFQTKNLETINSSINKNISEWYFNHRFRAVLFYFYFKMEIKSNTEMFEKIYDVGNLLYQGRNLNHRGTIPSAYQKAKLISLLPNQHKFYFKFMGFLEDFISGINASI